MERSRWSRSFFFSSRSIRDLFLSGSKDWRERLPPCWLSSSGPDAKLLSGEETKNSTEPELESISCVVIFLEWILLFKDLLILMSWVSLFIELVIFYDLLFISAIFSYYTSLYCIKVLRESTFEVWMYAFDRVSYFLNSRFSGNPNDFLVY